MLNNNLYIIYNDKNQKLFYNENELITYIKNNNLSNSDICIIHFLGSIYGMDDVIKKIHNGKSIICTPSLIGYYYFDENEGKWFGTYGSLKNEYEILKKFGVVLKHDIYDIMDFLNNNCHESSDKQFKL